MAFERVAPVRVLSPCTGVCRIDSADARCQGCARTLHEIARWTAMSEAERDRIMRELPERF